MQSASLKVEWQASTTTSMLMNIFLKKKLLFKGKIVCGQNAVRMQYAAAYATFNKELLINKTCCAHKAKSIRCVPIVEKWFIRKRTKNRKARFERASNWCWRDDRKTWRRSRDEMKWRQDSAGTIELCNNAKRDKLGLHSYRRQRNGDKEVLHFSFSYCVVVVVLFNLEFD